MTPRRRALLLLVLATLLGALAAANVRRREAALQRALGPEVRVLVTRTPVGAGAQPASARPLLRAVPRRYAPPDAVASALRLAGARMAVALPAGSILTASVLRAGAAAAPELALAPGERVAEVLAHGDPRAIGPGARVDVLVTREDDGARAGRTVLALQDVEVLAARPAPRDAADAGVGAAGARVLASLRVRIRDAVYLAAAQAFARDLRLLVRAPGDRAPVETGFSVDRRLR
jgi:pilus assembly protein CpaB